MKQLNEYEKFCPIGTKVRIIKPKGEDNLGWMVAPIDIEKSNLKLPDDYELVDGWGRVTKYDTTSELSHDGKRPIVVQDYIYCEFDKDLWEAYFT